MCPDVFPPPGRCGALAPDSFFCRLDMPPPPAVGCPFSSLSPCPRWGTWAAVTCHRGINYRGTSSIPPAAGTFWFVDSPVPAQFQALPTRDVVVRCLAGLTLVVSGLVLAAIVNPRSTAAMLGLLGLRTPSGVLRERCCRLPGLLYHDLSSVVGVLMQFRGGPATDPHTRNPYF